MSAKKTILVIDDDAFIATALKNILSKDGHTVHVAMSGEEGIPLCRETNPDLIICDRLMPGMQGHEVLKALRAEFSRKIPFVFLTSLNDPRDKAIAVDLQVDDYLEKPVAPAALRACVQKLLG